jgi:type IV pilus assembly protein PilE
VRNRRISAASGGFSLIEIMIVVVIVGILASVAFPSYTAYMKRGYRSQAEQLMSEIGGREVQYMLDARQYTATIGSGGLNVANKDGWNCTTTCSNSHYTVAVTLVSSPPGFFVTATPSGTQVDDGILYYNANTSGTYSEGLKTRTAGDNRW